MEEQANTTWAAGSNPSARRAAPSRDSGENLLPAPAQPWALPPGQSATTAAPLAATSSWSGTPGHLPTGVPHAATETPLPGGGTAARLGGEDMAAFGPLFCPLCLTSGLHWTGAHAHTSGDGRPGFPPHCLCPVPPRAHPAPGTQVTLKFKLTTCTCSGATSRTGPEPGGLPGPVLGSPDPLATQQAQTLHSPRSLQRTDHRQQA